MFKVGDKVTHFNDTDQINVLTISYINSDNQLEFEGYMGLYYPSHLYNLYSPPKSVKGYILRGDDRLLPSKEDAILEGKKYFTDKFIVCEVSETEEYNKVITETWKKV